MALPFGKAAVLQANYPWTQMPLICSAPMRLISGSSLAVAVSRAGGLGFIAGGGGSDLSELPSLLEEAVSNIASSPIPGTPDGVLPIGVGFLNWGADLDLVAQLIASLPSMPAAVWFFAPACTEALLSWTKRFRRITEGKTKIWVQVGSVASALDVVRICNPDVLVVQGCDAGGHGLGKSSSIINLVPEVADTLFAAGFPCDSLALVAAGGVMEGRGVAAALMLGASGVCMGTRFLATPEANISQGYKRAVVEANDGGINTIRTTLYDSLRGTRGWPAGYDGRGIVNKSFLDFQNGMSLEENKRLYEISTSLGDDGWGMKTGRLTTYAGTGVGLVRDIIPAGEVVEEVVSETKKLISFCVSIFEPSY